MVYPTIHTRQDMVNRHVPLGDVSSYMSVGQRGAPRVVRMTTMEGASRCHTYCVDREPTGRPRDGEGDACRQRGLGYRLPTGGAPSPGRDHPKQKGRGCRPQARQPRTAVTEPTGAARFANSATSSWRCRGSATTAARAAARRFTDRRRDRFPKDIRCLRNDLDTSPPASDTPRPTNGSGCGPQTPSNDASGRSDEGCDQWAPSGTTPPWNAPPSRSCHVARGRDLPLPLASARRYAIASRPDTLGHDYRNGAP